jgi:hypothetical protein
MWKKIIFICLFISSSILIHSAKMPQVGYEDPYTQEFEESDFWQYYNEPQPIDYPLSPAEGMRIMYIDPTQLCPDCYNHAIGLVGTSDENAFYDAYYDCVDNTTSCSLGSNCPEPAHNSALSLGEGVPVGTTFSILLFVCCYAAFCLYREKKNQLKNSILATLLIKLK